ncbi:uncharacterized protein LOC125236354 [Leguminivora glycinivorella]|uniref:uncharacterized protein LOC125236354 n=1 Tax=Leguminivora glycinivorella TaxID=1035111 RepID=UPI00200E6CCA|nr:uncharacterized protein LOC125236354 [Leguminivora glycinivorella]
MRTKETTSLQAKYYKGVQRPNFKIKDNVWLTKYTNNNKKITWIEGIVRKQIGKVMYLVYVPQLDCELTRHIDQLRAHPFPILSDNSQWDPDVVPDIPSSTSAPATPAAAAATAAPSTTSASAASTAPPAAADPLSSQPQEGERLDETATPADQDPARTEGSTTLTTPPASIRRRYAISPQFATPTQDYDTEETISD